jgi:hypothetical protein
LNDKRKLANRYELGDLIGRGGMAEVLEAVDTRQKRTQNSKTNIYSWRKLDGIKHGRR